MYFENDFSIVIKEAINILNNQKTSKQLSYINNTYKSISVTLLKLQVQGLLLTCL